MKLEDTLTEEYENLTISVQKKRGERKDRVSDLLEFTREIIYRGLAEFPQRIYSETLFHLEHDPHGLGESLTPEDITAFSIRLGEFQNEKYFSEMGFVLSALINFHYERTNCSDEYIIVTNHLEKNLNNIAYELEGNMRIKGNSYSFFAQNMKGSIIIEGDVLEIDKNFSGKISVLGNAIENISTINYDASITIEKNAYSGVRDWTNVGIMTIKGDAKEDVGYEMQKGDIFIHGDVEGYCGTRMNQGYISVRNNVKGEVGLDMKGGTILIDGSAPFLERRSKKREDFYDCPGIIIHNGNRICSREK